MREWRNEAEHNARENGDGNREEYDRRVEPDVL
jgi:hypothetical protein